MSTRAVKTNIAPSTGAASAAASGESLPESVMQASLQTPGGGALRLADFKGKVVVLNVWASWCPTCRGQIPGLVKLSREYAGRDVEVVGVTFEDPKADAPAVQKAVNDLGISYKITYMPRETVRSFAQLQNGKIPVPQTFVLGRDGSIVKKAVVMEDSEVRQALSVAGV